MPCSVPRLLGFRDWFEARFGPACARHDRLYLTRERPKWEADRVLFRDMVRAGRRYLPLAALVFLVCQTPWAWYVWWRD